MAKRKMALWRILALAYQLTIGWVISLAVMLIAFPLAILDILWQLLTGSDGIKANGTVFSFITKSLKWNAMQLEFGLIGKGTFSYLP